jgi:hypothetical protein
VRRDTAFLLARRPRVFLGSRAYVLVLSHMRSYSSLLCHILGSHPEIAGYAEMHLAYRSSLDLLRARARVARSLDGALPGRYVLDKILHDEYAVAASVLERADVYPVVLLRRPLRSIGSILRMGRDLPGVPWYSDPAQVTDYYVRRVEGLVRLTRAAASPYLFLGAEELVDEPQTSLTRIARYLNLETPLRDRYSIFPRTGEIGSGDSSPAIMAGRILPDSGPAAEPPLGVEQRDRATRVYRECRALLERGGVT